MSDKIDNVELRIVLIGDIGVGKKSIIKRFKILNCSETKEIKKKKPENKDNQIKHTNEKQNKNKHNTISVNETKTITKSETEEISKEEIEQKKYDIRREEKRHDLMNFTKIYKLNMNILEIHFFPCIEAQPLPYDYELKEDDEFYEFEKEYKVSIKQLVREIEYFIVKPAEDEKSQIEFLFMLCFDLSNIASFEDISDKYEINKNNNISFLFGYRFCLNIIFSENEKCLYYSLYESDKINYLKEEFYPGNDARVNLVYSQILNHFKVKPEEGCYACLCDKMYCHSVPSGFPGKMEHNMTCPKCSKNIGTENKMWGLSKDIKIVKRDGYYRIFKNENEIEEIKKNKKLRENLNEINYMTLEQFKKKFAYKIEKAGIYCSDAKNFKNTKKVIRNLSQVVYRLLNYILYSNLFFAKLILNKNDFDNFLPKKNNSEKMTWGELLSESWNILKNELLKENIDSIEEFMNFIFSDLFLILSNISRRS